jgi:hypothetical protein
MGLFDFFGSSGAEDAHNQVYGGQTHHSTWTHELLAGAAAFEALKAYEDQQAKSGKPVNHAFAKELVAGFAAAEADKLFESKGLDFLDREKAKHHAKEQATKLYDEKYL